MHPLFGRYRVHLVGRHAIGEHRIDVERGADGLCSIEPIAGHHHDTGGTGGAKCLHGAGSFAPELVAEKEGTDGPALDGDDDAKGGSPGGAAQRTPSPALRGPRPVDQLVGTDPDISSGDAALQTGAHSLSHVRRSFEAEAPCHGRLDNGPCYNVVRRLLEGCGEAQDLLGGLPWRGLNGDQARAANG